MSWKSDEGFSRRYWVTDEQTEGQTLFLHKAYVILSREILKIEQKNLPHVTRISSFLKLVVHEVSIGTVLFYLCQNFGFV